MRNMAHKAPIASQLRQIGLGTFSLLHFSVWRRCQVPVVIFTAWASLVFLFDLVFGMSPLLGAGSFIGILSMVTGLMVSFRSGSSYDRWYEGRRTWASVQSTSRNFLRLLVLSLPPPSSENRRQIEAIHELCAVVCAFAFATMYRLRDMPGVDHPELRALLPPALLESYQQTPGELRRNASVDSSTSLHYSSAPETVRAVAGLNTTPSIARSYPLTLADGTPTNLPLSLIRTIHAYLSAFHSVPIASADSPNSDTPALDGATWATALGHLKDYTDQLTALERIRDTPIPLILSLHLQLLLFVYIAAVPLQLVKSLGIWAVPATSVACLVFYGVEAAGSELSDPFGTEPNDLPIQKYCADIHREYLELSGISGSTGTGWAPTTVNDKKEQ